MGAGRQPSVPIAARVSDVVFYLNRHSTYAASTLGTGLLRGTRGCYGLPLSKC